MLPAVVLASTIFFFRWSTELTPGVRQLCLLGGAQKWQASLDKSGFVIMSPHSAAPHEHDIDAIYQWDQIVDGPPKKDIGSYC
jgi:hypothetical protein